MPHYLPGLEPLLATRPQFWRRFVLVIGLWLVVFPLTVRAQEAPQLQITSEYYIVLDADTGEIYAQRGAHQQAAMASLTKIFTTIEAIERASPSMSITTRDSDVFDPSSSLMGFGPGESFTMQDLLYGMMLPSGNDAAHAVARALGTQDGDTDEEAVARFVEWMNQRLKNMGLTDTHLENPHGWGVPNHYSSVYDLAAFTRYALQYPTFVTLISTPVYATSNGAYQVTNTNRMLNFYPGIIGGKTGYDDDAGYCLIEVARRDGSTMISVTLNGVAPDDWYDDNRVLLDYAFDQKAQRAAAGQPITGEIVRFRDPDAAVLGSTAQSSGSLPAPARSDASESEGPRARDHTPRDATSGASGGQGGAVPATGGSLRENADESPTRLLVAVGVAALLIGSRAFSGMVGSHRQGIGGGKTTR